MYEVLKRGDTVVVTGPAGIGRTGYALGLARAALADGGAVLFMDSFGETRRTRYADLIENPRFIDVRPNTIEAASTMVKAAARRSTMVILDGVDRLSTRRRAPRVGEGSIALMKIAELLDRHHGTTSVFLIQTCRGVVPSGVRLIEESTTSTPIVRVRLDRGARHGTADVTVYRADVISRCFRDVPVWRAPRVSDPCLTTT